MGATKEFKEALKTWVVEALKESKGVQVAHRPVGIKFDEGKAVIRFDVDTYQGFSIGDSCAGRGIWLHDPWATGHSLLDKEAMDAQYKEHLITAFVDITAYPKGGRGIRIRDRFCILARAQHFSIPFKRIVRMGVEPNAPIVLFWVGALKKWEKQED